MADVMADDPKKVEVPVEPAPLSKVVPMHISRTHTLCSVQYYGAVRVDAPSSATEINRNVLRFRQASQPHGIEALLAIPRLSGGFIHLLEPNSRTVLMSVPVKHIVYCARSARIPDCIGFTSNYHEPTMVVSIDSISVPPPGEASKEQPGLTGEACGEDDGGATGESAPGESKEGSPEKLANDASDPSAAGGRAADAQDTPLSPLPGTTGQADTTQPSAGPSVLPSAAASAPITPDPQRMDRPGSALGDGPDRKSSISADQARQRNEAAWHLHKDPNRFFCHVFRFQSGIKAEHALQCIAHAFGRMQIGDDGKAADPYKYQFEVSVGISEDDGKGSHQFCPMAKDTFKLRTEHARRLHITVTQCSSQHAIIERAFGVLTPDEASTTHPPDM
eukprot:m.121468 g.121468  ORF g.121468 m.121468 type:complete len:391 (+) comp9299_c0_seq4:3-1175(+)